jgi:hypothetical protein
VPRSTVVIELAGNAALARDLAAGGVFVPGCTLAMAEECELVVCGPSHRLSLPARVVYIDEQRGAGLELIGFSTTMRAQLAELSPVAPGSVDDDLALPTLCNVELSGDEAGDEAGDDVVAAAAVPVPLDRDDEYRTLPVPAGAYAAPDAPDAPDADDDLAVPVEDADDQHTVPVWTRSRARVEPVAAPPPRTSDLGHSDPAFAIAGIEADAAFCDAAAAPAEPARERAAPGDPTAPPEPRSDASSAAAPDEAPGQAPDAAPDEAPDEPPDEAPDEAPDATESPAARAPRHVHERLRGLTLAAQLKLAAAGELQERIVLERLYGKNVWETLLRNPRLTPPEVSRIARYGALPRVLLEIILGNATWLQVPEVRRALLTNPRLGTDQIAKVLRLTPKHELRLAAIQTAYPHAVRQAARLLLRGE